MSETVLKVENLYKRYRLGLVNHTALVDDINILWAKMTGKPNPTETYITANELVKAKKDDIKARYVWALQDINLEAKLQGMEWYEYEKRLYPHPHPPFPRSLKKFGTALGRSGRETLC